MADNYIDLPVTGGGGGGGAVDSVFGRTGDVTAQIGDYNTDLVTEGSTNLYFTDARARTAISAIAPVVYNGATGEISMPAATAGNAGYLSAADWSSFNAKVNRSGDSMSGYLTLVGDPVSGSQAATKNYVDMLADGLKWKTLVVAATVANITLSGEQTIDDIALVTGDRCLVKDQTDQTENGIYVVDSGAWARSDDADTGTELALAAVIIESGTVNGGLAYIQTTPEPITIGATNIVFVNFLSTTYTATEQGIKLSGTQFSLSIDGSTLSQSASGVKVADGGIGNTQINDNTLSLAKLANGNANRLIVRSAGGVVSEASAITANSVLVSNASGIPVASTATYSSGTFTFSNNLIIPVTTSSAGILYTADSVRRLHFYGTENVFIGNYAGNFTLTGTRNTAIGSAAMQSLTTGSNNTGYGYATLNVLTTGTSNTAAGQAALAGITTGANNSAFGALAGYQISSAASSVSYFGYEAGRYQQTGLQCAFGRSALTGDTTPANNTGSGNNAFGYQALSVCSTGANNNAFGYQSLSVNTSGNDNTVFGNQTGLNITTSSQHSFFGSGAGQRMTSGTGNTAMGFRAMRGSATPASNTGTTSVAIGTQALENFTTGSQNVAVGRYALNAATTPTNCVAVGMNASVAQTTAIETTAIGSQALTSNDTISTLTAVGFQSMQYWSSAGGSGTSQTAVGYRALKGNSTPSNNTGSQNTAIGFQAMENATSALTSVAVGVNALRAYTGTSSVAVGNGAMQVATSPSQNTALGISSLNSNTTGGNNTALGYAALLNITTGTSNVAVGTNAGRTPTVAATGNIFLGAEAGFHANQLVSANYSIALGYQAYTTASNQMVIGGTSSAINQIYMGKGVTDTVPTSVTLNATGGSGTNVGGASLTIAAGLSTGSANGGSINFNTSAVGASGTTLNGALNRWTIMQGGTLRGAYVHNNMNDAQGNSSQQDVRSGTYTPSAGATINISSSTIRTARYSRVGNVVTVAGEINLTCTTPSIASSIQLSLPIATNMSNTYEVSGTAITTSVTSSVNIARVIADSATDNALITFTASAASPVSQTWSYIYTYEVL